MSGAVHGVEAQHGSAARYEAALLHSLDADCDAARQKQHVRQIARPAFVLSEDACSALLHCA
jgi:hypothetical protein